MKSHSRLFTPHRLLNVGIISLLGISLGLLLISLDYPQIFKQHAATLCSTSPSGEAMPVGDLPGWHQVFTDDFVGTSLTHANWGEYSGQPGGDPAGWWDPTHVVVGNCMLSLTGSYGSSGLFVTGGVGGSFSQTYGKYLVRMRADKGDGISAIALLWPTNESWPPEIDFFEDGGGNRMDTSATLHCGANNNDSCQIQKSLSGVDFSQWHTVGVEWTKGKLVYTLDGSVWATVTDTRVPSIPMVLDLQSQSLECSQWNTCVNSSTPNHVNMEIDWVAIYAPSSVANPTATPGNASPTPVPTAPVSGSGSNININNNIVGTGLNQWNLVGSWATCSGCDAWSNVVGDTASLKFTGTQIAYHASINGTNGKVAVSIDGGAETTLDLYSATMVDDKIVWTSPFLPYGTHTFKVRVTGTKNASASDAYGSVLSADIVTTTPTLMPTPRPTNTPAPTPTGVLRPTNTPIPTATSAPSATKLSLILKLHGIGTGGDSVNGSSIGNQTPLHPSRSVTVTLTDTNNVTLPPKTGLVTYQASTGDFRGLIDLSTTPSGFYIGTVSIPGYLTTPFSGIISITAGQMTAVPAVSLVAGDANQDGRIDVLDYNVELDCYSDFAPARNCDSLKQAQTDITDDGKVNSNDINLFLREMSIKTTQ